jgi:hypothetical protein
VTTALLAIVGALAVFVLLLFGAMVELYRQILQLRQYVGLIDQSRALSFNTDLTLSDIPIPATAEIGDGDRTALLILSDRCTTCHEIAAHLPGVRRGNLLVLVEARTAADATQWLADRGMVLDQWTAYDEGGIVAALMGVMVTPAIVKYEGKYPVAASTVPSTRQLDKVLEWLGENVKAVPRKDGASS